MMEPHFKQTPEFREEIERLIETNLMKQWAGDKEGAGILRIIEILRNNTTDCTCTMCVEWV